MDEHYCFFQEIVSLATPPTTQSIITWPITWEGFKGDSRPCLKARGISFYQLVRCFLRLLCNKSRTSSTNTFFGFLFLTSGITQGYPFTRLSWLGGFSTLVYYGIQLSSIPCELRACIQHGVTMQFPPSCLSGGVVTNWAIFEGIMGGTVLGVSSRNLCT